MHTDCTAQSGDENDDFEIVPQDNNDDDVDMWDADGMNEDDANQKDVLSTSFELITWSGSDSLPQRMG